MVPECLGGIVFLQNVMLALVQEPLSGRLEKKTEVTVSPLFATTQVE